MTILIYFHSCKLRESLLFAWISHQDLEDFLKTSKQSTAFFSPVFVHGCTQGCAHTASWADLPAGSDNANTKSVFLFPVFHFSPQCI